MVPLRGEIVSYTTRLTSGRSGYSAAYGMPAAYVFGSGSNIVFSWRNENL